PAGQAGRVEAVERVELGADLVGDAGAVARVVGVDGRRLLSGGLLGGGLLGGGLLGGGLLGGGLLGGGLLGGGLLGGAAVLGHERGAGGPAGPTRGLVGRLVRRGLARLVGRAVGCLVLDDDLAVVDDDLVLGRRLGVDAELCQLLLGEAGERVGV